MAHTPLSPLTTRLYFARAGGGGHGGFGGGGGGFSGGGGGYYGGGSSTGGSSSVAGLIFFLIFFFGFLAVVIYLNRKDASNPFPKPRNGVEWPSEAAKTIVSGIYFAFQRDWSELNPEGMQAYLTHGYFYNVNLMLLAMRAAQRRNNMVDVRLLSAYPVAINPSDDQSRPSTMIVQINGQASDSLVDDASGTVFYTDTKPFSEYWHFVQEGTSWRLDNITQTTEFENDLNSAIQSFANANKYFYSGEWGSLLIPDRGQLFTKATFLGSAVNNHVIGLYKNCIIEFYSYLPDKHNASSFTVAQAFLPKSYGNIVVRRKEGLLHLKPHGLTKVEMEWPDFNKKYDVYATSAEQATSFELLNPAYMEKVEALPFPLSIEVVDNVVYLYTDQHLEDYAQMQDTLYRAFQEMKL